MDSLFVAVIIVGKSFDVMVNGKAVSEELKRATCRKTVIKFSFFSVLL